MNAESMFRFFPYVGAAIGLVGLFGRVLGLFSRAHDGKSVPDAKCASVVSLGRGAWSLLLAGHLLGVLAPGAVLAWIASPARLYLLEGTAFVVGLSTLVAWTALAARHLARSGGGALAAVVDSAFLGFVFVGVASGLAVSVVDRWGSAWGATALTPYLATVASGAPRTEYLVRMPPLVQLHVVSFFGVVAAFPFTSYATAAIVMVAAFPSAVVRAVRGAVVPWRHRANRPDVVEATDADETTLHGFEGGADEPAQIEFEPHQS
jgi:nitrate reductase gamma subunit